VRGPAFPAWLAAGLTISRARPWIALWSEIPGELAAIGVSLLLMRTHGSRAALWGGLLVAANPLALFASARLLPDEFYGTVLIGGMAAWTQAFRDGDRWTLWSIVSGVLLGVAALTRVTAVGVLGLLIVMTWGRERRCKQVCLVATLVAALPVGAWALRTTALAGTPTLIDSLPGYNFWLGEAADRNGFAASFAESKRRAHALMTAEAGTTETADPSFRYMTLDPRQTRAFDAKLVSAARTRILHHPMSYALRFVKGLVWFWCRAETSTRTLHYALVSLPFLLLAFAGLRVSWCDAQARTLAMVIALHVVVYAAICPMARYSVQLSPILGMLGGIGVSAMISGMKRESAPIVDRM
jgi:hypothetical protein